MPPQIALYAAALLTSLLGPPRPGSLEWATSNLGLSVPGSYCYGDAEPNCTKYGRLYTWDAARKACGLLDKGWRLPSDKEWRLLAQSYGGISAESADSGRGAFRELSVGGRSGFNAMLGGGRDGNGGYARRDAHGFYWTSTEDGPTTAVFYNFGNGGAALHRQPQGEKGRAFSVRCVRETP